MSFVTRGYTFNNSRMRAIFQGTPQMLCELSDLFFSRSDRKESSEEERERTFPSVSVN